MRTPTRKPWFLLAALCAAGSAAAKPEESKPTWRKWVNGYEIVRWAYREHPGVKDPASRVGDRTTVVLRDPAGRTVARFSINEAGVAFVRLNGPSHAPMVALFSEHYTGDSGRASHFGVYSLGRRPRCLVAYTTLINRFDNRFQAVDLDHDGRDEILTEYDGLGGIANPWWSGYSLPMVLAYRHGRYVDATRHYPAVLRREIWTADAAMRQALKGNNAPIEWPAQSGSYVGGAFDHVVRCYALRVLLHGPRAAIRDLLPKLPHSYRKDLIAHRDDIEGRVANRSMRLSYPAPYSHWSWIYEESPGVGPPAGAGEVE